MGFFVGGLGLHRLDFEAVILDVFDLRENLYRSGIGKATVVGVIQTGDIWSGGDLEGLFLDRARVAGFDQIVGDVQFDLVLIELLDHIERCFARPEAFEVDCFAQFVVLLVHSRLYFGLVDFNAQLTKELVLLCQFYFHGSSALPHRAAICLKEGVLSLLSRKLYL